MKTIKNLLVVLGFGLLSATATAQNPETGALMTDPNIGCAYGYDQYGYMNCGGSGGSSGSARPQPPKVINRYGAIAWNTQTNLFDSAYNENSAATAKQLALTRCGNGCRVISSYSNQCVAAAIGSPKNGRGTYIATSPNINSKIAESKALASCNAKAKNCQIVLSECSKYN